jgi:AraC-like DNA-binding protein
VREELKASGPDSVTVTQVAGRWGFVHLGRFASAYRRKFGESPSATLRGQP